MVVKFVLIFTVISLIQGNLPRQNNYQRPNLNRDDQIFQELLNQVEANINLNVNANVDEIAVEFRNDGAVIHLIGENFREAIAIPNPNGHNPNDQGLPNVIDNLNGNVNGDNHLDGNLNADDNGDIILPNNDFPIIDILR